MENKELQTQSFSFSQSDAMMQTIFNPVMFEQMQRAATLYSKSGMVGSTFENNTAACFLGLQLAVQLNINPFMLFQKIYSPGKGKIGIETQVAIAVANKAGVFVGPIVHTFAGEGETRSCTATATLANSGKEVSLTIDWKTVVGEGWNKDKGSQVSKWKTMPDQMFRYRSSLWLIRTYCPEVLLGLNSIDELDDIQVINVTPAKTIDEAFKAMAEDAKPTEVTEEQQKELDEKPVETTTKQAEADTLEAIVAEIDSYNIPLGALTAFVVRSIGQNKSKSTWDLPEAQKILDAIKVSKGGKK